MKSPVVSKDSLQHSNLVELLKTFTKDEIREFDKFVRSPFHNNRRDVVRYYTELKKFYPGFDKKTLSREMLFSRLYPSEKYNDATIRLLGSKLMTAAENYLSYKTLMKKPFLLKINFLQNLIQRKQEKLFEKIFKETEQELENDKKRNSEYFEKKYQIETVKNLALEELHYKTKTSPDIVAQMKYSIDYFLISVVPVYLTLKNQSTLYSLKKEFKILENLIKELEDYDFEQNPVLRIYLMFLRLQDEQENEELFYCAHKELINNFDKIEFYEFRNFHINLTNYCDYKIFVGNSDFKKVKFDLFKEKIKYNLHLNDRSEFLDFSFIRYIETACLNRDFEWAENFINNYGPLLNPLDRDNLVNFAWADVECVRGNFDKCLEHLKIINFKDIIEKMQIKVLYLRCYYETKSYNETLSLIDSVRHTINNKKEDPYKHLSPHLKLCYGNYVNFLEKLVKFALGESKESKDEFRNKIRNVNETFDRNWLIRKLDEL